MRGICVNHRCKRFEYVVEVDSDQACCDECGQLLCHESGLTWGDARKKGYASAFKVTVLAEAKPPPNRSAKTRYHHAEVGKPGEVGGAGHLPPDPSARSRAARKTWAKRRRKRGS